MIALLLFLSSTETINFYVDPVVYRCSAENLFYLEFNCEIPYQELYYETIDNDIFAKATIAFWLSDLVRFDSLVDTLYRKFTIPSFYEAARQQMSFIVQFGLHVPAGEFEYTIEIASGDKKSIIKQKKEIMKAKYKISDILVASNIISDTTGNYLRKGNLKVFPRPSRLFNDNYTVLYVYYEIYDITTDSNSLEITYKIEDSDNKTIRKISRCIDKKFESQAINFGLSTEGISAGEYIFSIDVRDPSTQMIVKKEISFTIKRAIRKEVSYEGMPYYEDIEYFLESKDYKYFKSLPEKGKAIFLERFWQSHDYFEIAERFKYADEYYRQGYSAGSKTDRGRIYICCGAPDEIERSIIEYYESRPYEHWHYNNGEQFLFLDIVGTGEYELVWTNASGEQSRPTLYKYIPPDKSDLVR